MTFQNPSESISEISQVIHQKSLNIKETQKNQFEEDTEINHIHWYFDREDGGSVDEYEFDMRMIYPDTMDRVLSDSDFTIDEKWGDYDGEPFDETSLLQLYICSKRS